MQKETNHPMLLAAQQQLYDYTLRLRLAESYLLDRKPSFPSYPRYDSRFCEESKPNYSYIGLIAMAILSSPSKQLVLADIYQWISDHYGYFRTRGTGWRNSIRHNLSLNDCFVKASRSANGKGHYWSIHPANMEDFLSGDFRRRRAQRRVRKSVDLSLAEDDNDEDVNEVSPMNRVEQPFEEVLPQLSTADPHSNSHHLSLPSDLLLQDYFRGLQSLQFTEVNPRKRCFDVDSLLAPEQPSSTKRSKSHSLHHNPHFKSDDSTDTNK